jgi:phage terminase small subunit
LSCIYGLTSTPPQAAILAGYAPDKNSAKVIACRLLSVYPNVMEELRRRVSEMTGVDFTWYEDALQELRRTKALYRGWRSLMKR